MGMIKSPSGHKTELQQLALLMRLH